MPVEYEITIEDEELDFRGNYIASGDDAYDRKCEEWIASELDRGNQAAWCWVCVTARFEGFKGSDSLGGCSYKSMKDLEKNLIPEMKVNARADLLANIRRASTEAVKDARAYARKAKAALKALEGSGS
jgi:hypothetical protein